ncbi:peptide MFS transporter [Gimibacter soli]|uniref:Peptide MFS transporter n=1 Tax=Gimibacter soli TaxID=3024400 RepID=A0AAE9XX01_9PROT|nr:peptide MFS transporter [Gimibacter soli]WCL55044.1 peptide MFS transporter [Gimibacter soli]
MAETHLSERAGSQEREFLGHPIGLVVCFLTEMWERFSYYGMRTILVLYLVKYHLFDAGKASMIYGAYAGLVYMMPIIGGYLADRYLGSRKAVTYGAILLVAGHSLMAAHGPHAERYLTIDGNEYQVEFVEAAENKTSEAEFITMDGTRYRVDAVKDESGRSAGINLVAEGQDTRLIATADYDIRIKQHSEYLSIFFLALALIITGVGFLKANISTIVGALYGPKDPRRDGGFSIFYMGINLGSVLSTALVGYVGEKYGWNYGFGLAGIGMLFGLLVFLGGQKLLEGRAEPTNPAILKEKSPIGINKEWTIYLSGILMVALAWFLMHYQDFVGQLLGVSGFVMVGILVLYSIMSCEKEDRQRLWVATFLIVFQMFFWALFEQQAASLTLLADQQFDLDFLGITFLASQVQLLNPLFIVMFAPVMAWLWVKLNHKNAEPSTPAKFAISMLLIGLGYVVFAWGMGLDDSTEKSFLWMVFIYLSLTLAELCLSPVGLSMVTKLSAPRIVGMVMGTWFLFTAMGNYAAGWISSLAGAAEHGADAGLLDMTATMDVYTTIGLIAIGVGAFIFVMTPLLKKGMHGVH